MPVETPSLFSKIIQDHLELKRRNAELERKNAELMRSQMRTDRVFSALSEVLPGTVLDDTYRLDAKIGEGGFGAVFRGMHLIEHELDSESCGCAWRCSRTENPRARPTENP